MRSPLEGYYNFNDGSQAGLTLGNSAGGYNRYRTVVKEASYDWNSIDDPLGEDSVGDNVRDVPFAPTDQEMTAKVSLLSEKTSLPMLIAAADEAMTPEAPALFKTALKETALVDAEGGRDNLEIGRAHV